MSAGFRIAIDDAGPALPHWRDMLQLPFNALKLDGTIAGDASLSAEIVDAAKRAGLFVVAEGIEDEATAQRMRGLGVDALQGFLYSRPLPAMALPLWMAQRGRR
jgi:cyclic di-GMP phosphodiesterase Gmr